MCCYVVMVDEPGGFGSTGDQSFPDSVFLYADAADLRAAEVGGWVNKVLFHGEPPSLDEQAADKAGWIAVDRIIAGGDV